MKDVIEFVEGEAYTETFSWVRDGTAINLTGYTVTLQMKDENATTLRITSGSCTLLTQSGATLGQVTFPFTATHTTMTSPDTEARGTITIKATTGATLIEKRKFRYIIEADPTIH